MIDLILKMLKKKKKTSLGSACLEHFNSGQTKSLICPSLILERKKPRNQLKKLKQKYYFF